MVCIWKMTTRETQSQAVTTFFNILCIFTLFYFPKFWFVIVLILFVDTFIKSILLSAEKQKHSSFSSKINVSKWKIRKMNKKKLSQIYVTMQANNEKKKIHYTCWLCIIFRLEITDVLCICCVFSNIIRYVCITYQLFNFQCFAQLFYSGWMIIITMIDSKFTSSK